MSDDAKPEVTVFMCGPSNKTCKCNCPESCEHKWDGPPVPLENNGWSVTCSRCSVPAIDHDMWVGP